MHVQSKSSSNSLYEQFKKILPSEGVCPVSNEMFSKLKIHTDKSCLNKLTYFSKFLTGNKSQKVTSCIKSSTIKNPQILKNKSQINPK